VLVYIAEAHAQDTWPINSTRCSGPGNTILTPKTLEERRSVARRCVDALRLEGTVPVLLDGMDDAFLETYAAWPIRLFGIGTSGRIERIANPRDATFELAPFRDWMLAATA
jgi:hypothetical protein